MLPGPINIQRRSPLPFTKRRMRLLSSLDFPFIDTEDSLWSLSSFNRLIHLVERDFLDRFTRITKICGAVVDECGLGSSIVGVDVFHSEVVGGEILLGHSKLGDLDVVALLVKKDVAGLELDRYYPLAP